MAARIRLATITFLLALAPGLIAAPAAAIDFFDRRLEVHGSAEMQLRAIAKDLNPNDGLDLTQWYNVLTLETEADFAPDGFGPFDIMTGFMRLEARFDCVWTHGCALFPSVDAFGNKANRLPHRLADGRRAGYRATGNIFNRDTRAFRDIPRDKLPYEYFMRPDGARTPSALFNIQGFDTLYDSAGVDGVFGSADDPAPFYFKRQEEDCRFTFRKKKGSMDTVGHQIMPWNPFCEIEPIGVLSRKPNPLSDQDFSPITGGVGAGARPLRPAPEQEWTKWSPDFVARGVYYPNERLAQLLRDREFDDFDQNFSQSELQWNLGASQQDETILKELYVDIEMFDSRLWMRLGKQAVVWGKTELFRNQDQWNPVDLALASLPSLEEARVGLWMGRFVWQFWSVGPVEDLRAELVIAYDHFEPTDLGRCGEPYAPNPVCDKTMGLFAHGLTGFGIAGEVRPPNPWDSFSGIEVGGRVEFRWKRFSFAVSDYWGYDDFFYIDPVFNYSRNVDPYTGRPRHTESTGRCKTGRDGACLKESNALERHSVNQQLFSMICATSLGFTDLDSTACGQTVFNSVARTGDDPSVPSTEAEPRVLVALNSVLAGDPLGQILPGLSASLSGVEEDSLVSILRLADQMAPFGVTSPLIVLNKDVNDGGPDLPADHPLRNEPDYANTVEFFYTGADGSISARLTDAQEALLGCGAYYGTSCDLDGIDLMNAEASALFMSFPGIEGTFGTDWDTTDASVQQPGTVGFSGGPACTRFEGGRLFVLPGCRGPGDKGYDPGIDGTPTGLVHPFTKQQFKSEMAALSWNALMGLVAFSAAPEITITTFDIHDVLRTDGCSFRKVSFCSSIQSFFQITGVQRNVIRAAGNGSYGRRDFVWHGGRNVALRYQRKNVLGFSTDFAEDVTKSNWGVEFTWVDNQLTADNDFGSGLNEVDFYNLTVSVDRPTFINFLNANRTFFFNTQWFFQYVSGYSSSMPRSGPWNVLAVFAINTGYMDDRLLPSMNLVYDFASNSGGFIPQIQYRYSAEFSITFGMAWFWGREEARPMALSPNSLGNRVGRGAYNDFVENGLSAIRDRDELFMRLRYTF